MTAAKGDAEACRWGAHAALSAMVGIVVSGPFALMFLSVVAPQPPWSDAEVFAQHYRAIQSLPYFAGFLLVGGFVALMASLAALAPAQERARAATALVLTAAFAALVFFNYVVQTTFVPNLARHYTPDKGPVIAAFSMVNPSSLAWALEMWAYGFLGVANFLIAPVFTRAPIERAASRLFIANGVGSLIAAVWAAADPTWMMTPAGLVAYTSWNVLVFVMVLAAFVALRRRVASLA
jgi:hypothetical protein